MLSVFKVILLFAIYIIIQNVLGTLSFSFYQIDFSITNYDKCRGLIFFRDDLKIIFTIHGESLFKSFQHRHSAFPNDREDSSLTQNAVLSSFSRDRTFLLGSPWFKGSHDFALSRIHRGSRPIFLLTSPRGAARVLHSGFFQDFSFHQNNSKLSLWHRQTFASKSDTSNLTVLIFFFSSTAGIKF